MAKKQVLVVDDSAAYRRMVGLALAEMADVEVAGYATDGREALAYVRRQPIDVITLDFEMPVLDGLHTLEALRRENFSAGKRPRVLMLSAMTQKGAAATLEAMALGADDFLCKPGLAEVQSGGVPPKELLRRLLVPKLRQFFSPAPAQNMDAAVAARRAVLPPPHRLTDLSTCRARAVVIASSTGGPAALEGLFKYLRAAPPVPVFIVQHMPPLFTASLAARLAAQCNLSAQEAKNEALGEPKVYIAPGDFHLKVGLDDKKNVVTILGQEPKRNYVRPAADHLFESAAKVFGKHLLALVLTGMGSDGCAGALAVKQAGGVVAIQQQSSCVVYGMPKAVEEAAAFDRKGDLPELAALIDLLTRH